MRDTADNVVIVCSIENLDPMGVHTGDSITVAPAQTLTDKEYQLMRDAALAHHPRDRRRDRRLEHPVRDRSRHRPHGRNRDEPARLAQLRAGVEGDRLSDRQDRREPRGRLPLDEIPNDITRKTPACFEPTIDYVVTKIPRFTFEKFRGAVDELGPQMKSVGEVMAIGRTFKESLQKALALARNRLAGTREPGSAACRASADAMAESSRASSRPPAATDLYHLADASRLGMIARGNLPAEQDRSVVHRRGRGNRRGRSARRARRRSTPACSPRVQARWAFPIGASPSCAGRSEAAVARQPPRSAACTPGVQDGRHLRRRVRGLHAVSLFDLRRRGRSQSRRPRARS